MAMGLLGVWDEFLCWVFFLINCVGVLGFHGGEREREREREREKIRERHKYILLYKYIILMYCIRK